MAEAAPRPPGAGTADVERRCTRLLRERLDAELAQYEAGEHLRAVNNISSPLHRVRKVFAVMPTRTPEDWAAIAQRLRAVPECPDGYRASLAEGVGRGTTAAPRQHWTFLADGLSRYQTKVAKVSATTEGWALYAERLMDELGFLTDPAHRLGHLDAQMVRALRVIVDIGMHLRLRIPAGSPLRPGERWTPALAREFLGRYSSRPAARLDSEVIRYLGRPGQAVSYKLGERAWLEGRERARAGQGAGFDLKRWRITGQGITGGPRCVRGRFGPPR